MRSLGRTLIWKTPLNSALKNSTDWKKDQRIKLPEEILRIQRYKDCGAPSEKDSGQGHLFNEAEEDSFVNESETAEIMVPANTHKKKKRVSILGVYPVNTLFTIWPKRIKSVRMMGQSINTSAKQPVCSWWLSLQPSRSFVIDLKNTAALCKDAPVPWMQGHKSGPVLRTTPLYRY